MLATTPLSPRAYAVVASSPVTAQEMRAMLTGFEAILNGAPHLDMLIDVRGPTHLAPGMFIEEARHLPLLFRLVRALERFAVVADESWVRALARIERRLIPGLEYEIFTRDQIDHARAWVLRETDIPHPQG